MRSCPPPSAPSTSRPPTRKRSRPSSSARGSKGSCPRSSHRMRFITPACWRGSSVRAGASSCVSRGAVTRTWTRLRATSSRLEKALKADGDLKLIVYVMAGHPTRKKSLEIAKRVAASGVAALEIGVPHSDPLADGPVIQKAGQTALAHGMTMDACLELASEVSGVGPPVVLMSYVNPILAHDPRRFAADAAQAGVAGVIVPDMPIEVAERARTHRAAGGGRIWHLTRRAHEIAARRRRRSGRWQRGRGRDRRRQGSDAPGQGAFEGMSVRGIRGATTATANTAEAITEATDELLRELIKANLDSWRASIS